VKTSSLRISKVVHWYFLLRYIHILFLLTFINGLDGKVNSMSVKVLGIISVGCTAIDLVLIRFFTFTRY